MSTHKHIDKICLVAAALALILCILFMRGEALGIKSASDVLGYEERLFDTAKVHTINIIIDDWDAFLETAQSEEYTVCDVVIDGEKLTDVGIRGKGNTSLSTVSGMNSRRYSFKIEFDQYDGTKTYHGPDKLSLNNVIQDNTYMKDYLTYRMMNEFCALRSESVALQLSGSSETVDGSALDLSLMGTMGGMGGFGGRDFGGRDFGGMGGFGAQPGGAQGAGGNMSSLILLAVSLIFLAVSLIVAFKYKR